MDQEKLVVCKLGDLPEGQLKLFTVGDKKVLLFRRQNKIFALSPTCPHYGAPLEKGFVHNGRLLCPWHQAAFDIETGALLEPPARDGLHSLPVEISDENIIVTLAADTSAARLPEMARLDEATDQRTFVIIGAGAAGNAAAQALREAGYHGRIVIFTEEGQYPYDRTILSKDFLQGTLNPDYLPLRSQKFYEDYGIEVFSNTRITEFDLLNRYFTLENGLQYSCDAALIATGGLPRRIAVPGAELGNIFYLRNHADAERIAAACREGARAAIIGASFIGLETAFSLTRRKITCEVITPQTVPFESIFGKEIGRLFQEAHEKIGVKFHPETSVAHFEGDQVVRKVFLQSGAQLEVDLVVIGIGVRPATDFIRGIALGPDGSIRVDRQMRAIGQVFAAGDIARVPDWRDPQGIRSEHWRTAEQQGRIAALNMAGKSVPYEGVPFFWTSQAGLQLRYVGYSRDWEELIVHGEISPRGFLAYYVKAGKVHAVAGHRRDHEINIIHELFRLGRMPEADRLRDQSFDPAHCLPG